MYPTAAEVCVHLLAAEQSTHAEQSTQYSSLYNISLHNITRVGPQRQSTTLHNSLQSTAVKTGLVASSCSILYHLLIHFLNQVE